MTSILDSLHYLKTSKYFLWYAFHQAKGSTKNRFGNYIKRIDWIIGDIGLHLHSDDARDLYRQIIGKSDSVGLTNVIEGIHGLNAEQLELVENLVNALNSGEEITFEKENK